MYWTAPKHVVDAYITTRIDALKKEDKKDLVVQLKRRIYKDLQRVLNRASRTYYIDKARVPHTTTYDIWLMCNSICTDSKETTEIEREIHLALFRHIDDYNDIWNKRST